MQTNKLETSRKNNSTVKIMHALGFYHEHQRPDRDNFVNVDTTKMTSNCFKAFKILNRNDTKIGGELRQS